MRILFVGDLNTYGRGYQRCRTLREMGYEVVAYSHTLVSAPGTIASRTLLYRVFSRLRFPLDDVAVNEKLLEETRQSGFDIVWIEKGNTIRPATLAKLKRQVGPDAILLSCSEDDMFARHGHSIWYRLGLHHYDCVYTTKKYNLGELKQLGARRTAFFLDSYDEKIHRPFELTDAERERFSCDVSAIGAFEPARAESLRFLASNGIRVVVWGNGWSDWVGRFPNLDVRGEFLFGEDYSKAICATRINLNFLRKINRDEITSRSMEIPACGGFMLAERSARHLDAFAEGDEAEFFSSNEELLRKVSFYLGNESDRWRLAENGRRRCLQSGYSMREQLRGIVDSALMLKHENRVEH